MKKLCCVISFLATSISATAAPPSKDVNVTNDESSPVPVTIQEGSGVLVEYQVVGYTAPTDGDVETLGAEGNTLQGIAAMHHLCMSVDPSWRAAFSLEFQRTRDLPAVPGSEGRAWLIPTEPTLASGPDPFTGEVGWLAVDGTGESGSVHDFPSAAMQGLSCNDYLTDSEHAAGLVGGGTAGHVFSVGGCDHRYPVACASPVALPVTTAR